MTNFYLNETSARSWSKIGPRATYGLALLDLVERNPKVIVASADLGNSSGLDRLSKAFPERFINTGIAEQNLLGIAAGIAKEGFTVFASSFAPFITMRACEQMRLNMGYMELNVKAVGIGSGLSMNFLGNSHFGLEDISIVRSIPNIQIVSPADCGEIVKALNSLAESEKPTYLRLTGVPGMPILNYSDYKFEIGKFIELLDGEDITIIATGSMVYTALQVAKEFSQFGIKCGVVNCHTITPIDILGLKSICSRTSRIVTLEEHYYSGGLGTEVEEVLNKLEISIPILKLGISKTFTLSGSYDFLIQHHKLDVASVVASILRYINH